MLLGYREKPSFSPWDEDLACIIRRVQRCVERAMAYGALAALDDRPRPGKRADDHAGGQGLVGIFGLRQGQSTAIRMNCGRHGFWPAMRASADRRRVTNVSPVWLKAPCKAAGQVLKSSRTRCATIWNAATPSSSPRWRKFCVSTARSTFRKKPLERLNRRIRSAGSSLRSKQLGIQAPSPRCCPGGVP